MLRWSSIDIEGRGGREGIVFALLWTLGCRYCTMTGRADYIVRGKGDEWKTVSTGCSIMAKYSLGIDPSALNEGVTYIKVPNTSISSFLQGVT